MGSFFTRTSIKGQVLADFVVEFAPKHLKVLWVKESRPEESWKEMTWQVYVDRASNCRGVGVGVILISLEGIRMEKSFRLDFQVSNNEAEYEAFLVGASDV